MAIIPGMTELTRPYWAAAGEHRLVTQHCRGCDRIWHPPLPRCPHCHATELDWRPAGGEGTVYSYTVVEHATHVAVADQVPYVVAIVELAEGPRIVANIRGCAPADVSVGMPVRVVFEQVTDDVAIPQFVPAEGDGG
ncbi:MAG: hypothetical protein GEV03_08920 [Streptosporangiales bacterium]|nr:hypothetical protein [Streptosporangiales bacterium]